MDDSKEDEFNDSLKILRLFLVYLAIFIFFIIVGYYTVIYIIYLMTKPDVDKILNGLH